MKTQIKKAGKTMMLAAMLLSTTLVFVSCSNTRAGDEKSAMSSDDSVYTQADKMPKFDGDLSTFLKNTIKYPDTNVEGVVYLGFIVSKDGSVTNVKVIKSSNNNELDNEAVRAVSAMPKWIPGEKDGKKVNVSFNLPIHFKSK